MRGRHRKAGRGRGAGHPAGQKSGINILSQTGWYFGPQPARGLKVI